MREYIYMNGELRYNSGFGNHFETEALEGALPTRQNSPQRAPYGLYAEQFSGSAFTAPRSENQRTWFYRIRPSVLHGKFEKISSIGWQSRFEDLPVSPNQLRWDPFPAENRADFFSGLKTVAGNGDPALRNGSAVHVYSFNQGMKDKFFSNADGEMIFVPWKGEAVFRTECGMISVGPGEIALIPRGLRFHLEPAGSDTCSGYICENYGRPFQLPYLGPIGANGLANARHFLSPVARYEDRMGKFQIITKFQGELWSAEIDHSPLDVVAWTGNYTPYKYDLRLFNTINTVSFDHPDPSIFTVLTSPSNHEGTANVDFVIFPERWMVAEDTFRPPYYHRNIMSEYMGLIYGAYDAKQGGFVPGGGSLHNCMQAHGPDATTFENASKAELKPNYLKDTLAFMFESSLVYRPTKTAMESPALQKDYLACWRGLKSQFDPKKI
jgi:homogentisate 1,2-dioxygenase